MESEILNKEIAEKLMQIKGEARGMHLKNDADFVLKKVGPEGLKKVEEELNKVGFPIHYQEIRPLGFYPVGWRALSLLAIKKALGWEDGEMRELGRFAVAFSLLVRVYMKYFHAAEKMIKEAPKMWRDYFTRGDIVVADFNEEKKQTTIVIKDFDLHPAYCLHMEGWFETLVKMVMKAPTVKCREVRCSFRNQGKNHEFLVKWQ